MSIQKIVLFFSLMALISSCNKKETDPIATGSLYIHLHTNIGTTEVDEYNTVYTNTDGRKVSLSLAQMYISNIQLVKADGSVYAVPNSVILKTKEVEPYFIGKVPVGDYKSIQFNVGLDPSTNQKIPANASDTILYQPSMWFGNTAQAKGYVFFNLQGKVDTTAAGNGTLNQMMPFVYKIGTDVNYKTVVMPQNKFTVVKDENAYQHIVIDYAKAFDNLKLFKSKNLSVLTQDDNANWPGSQIADNIPSMFSFE